MKIALFKQPLSEYSFVTEVETGTVMDYVRVSEEMEVEFIPLPLATTKEAELASLRKKEEQVRQNFERRMKDIEGARGKLNGT